METTWINYENISNLYHWPNIILLESSKRRVCDAATSAQKPFDGVKVFGLNWSTVSNAFKSLFKLQINEITV